MLHKCIKIRPIKLHSSTSHAVAEIPTSMQRSLAPSTSTASCPFRCSLEKRRGEVEGLGACSMASSSHRSHSLGKGSCCSATTWPCRESKTSAMQRDRRSGRSYHIRRQSHPLGRDPERDVSCKACTIAAAEEGPTMAAHGMLVLSWARISSMTSALARLPPPRACWAAPLSSCMSMGSRSSADS